MTLKCCNRQLSVGNEKQNLHHLSPLEKRLINQYQKGLPVTSQPYAEIARAMGITETRVLQILQRLQKSGVVSRVGPIFEPNRVGASTLAAMAVPERELTLVAEQVSRYPEVNHNYEREHRFNLWFVVTSPSKVRLHQVLSNIEGQTGYRILRLPLVKRFHINLGFPL